MKIGLIVECTEQGLEDCVCRKIFSLLETECGAKIDPKIVFMLDKKALIRECAKAARALLNEGYQRIVVLWDENPPWTPQEDYAKERCWHTERETILAGLKKEVSATERRRVGLVCVEREFEAILLHDRQLLCDVVSPSKQHAAKIPSIKRPELIDDPKAMMMKLCRDNKTRYNKAVMAAKFAKHLNRLDAIKNCDIFRLFVQNVLGKMPRGWQPYAYKPRGPGL